MILKVHNTINSANEYEPDVLNAFCATRVYSLSRKTVNARENFWNVYCFTTNQMRDETAKDNRQTAEWINYDLTRNNEFALYFFFHEQF